MSRLVPRWGARLTALMAISCLGFGVANFGQGAVAHADPLSSTALNGVGSDTLQDLTDAYSGYDAGQYYTPLTVNPSSAFLPVGLNSWDAVPSGNANAAVGSWCLTTQFGGPSFDRPNGSSEGATALNDSLGSTAWSSGTAGHQCAEQNGASPPAITGQLQFSRSSRGPKGTSGPLTFIPFARDAVTVAVWDGSPGANQALLGQLTRAQLATWYATPATPGTITVGSTTYTVNLCLPQSGSGTRSFWFTALGISTDPGTTSGCASLEENGGNSFQTAASTLNSGGTINGVTGTAGSISIMPFSVGSWLSQVNGFAVNRTSTGIANGVYLDTLDVPAGGSQTSPCNITTGGSTTPSAACLPVAGSTLSPNTNFYQSTNFGRNIYYVVGNTKLSLSATLKAMFSNTGGTTTPAVCSAAAQAIAHNFGFDSLTGSEGTCGSTSQTGT